MNTPTNIQVINNADGMPAFVVVPYHAYIKQYGMKCDLIPNEVVGMVIEKEFTPIRSWREHLGFTQAEVASRLNITPMAFAQIETSTNPNKSTLRRVADVLGITVEQLNF